MIRKTFPAFLALLTSVTVWVAPFPATASPAPEWLACPDIAEVDVRTARVRGVEAAKEIAPTTDAKTSADLSAFARLSMASYEMYDAFDRGEDPLAFLPEGLGAVAAIYGDPGRDTESRRRQDRRDTTTFYGVVADEASTDRRFILMRGTLQPNEWLRNLQARQSPYPDGTRRFRAQAWVHNGFLKIFSSLRAEADRGATPLSQALPGLISGREVVVIGHSLGGALATLTGVEAARLSPDDAPRIRIVTFGSPRVGDPGFAAMARAVGRIERVCNLPDVVTAVPPSFRRATYTHVGELFAISSFDWPQSNNDLDGGAQLLCWHSIYSYRYMTDPEKVVIPELEACLKRR